MAEGKKSVLLYCDLIHTVEKMDDKTAGLFFKHYLRYINDLHPETDNLVVDISFESVKQNLKRDLKKWEQRAENSRKNGAKGGRPRTQETQRVNLEPKEPVKDTVTVNVNDKVIVKDIKQIEKKFVFRKALIDFGFDKDLVNDWLIVRKLKKAANTETAFNGFINQIEKANIDKNEILKICIEKSWSGFKTEWLDNLNNNSKTNNNGVTKSRREKFIDSYKG